MEPPFKAMAYDLNAVFMQIVVACALVQHRPAWSIAPLAAWCNHIVTSMVHVSDFTRSE